MSKIELVPYIPETSSYKIWHPKNFKVEEDEYGIVTITSPITYSNLTFSGYQINQDVTEETLLDFFHNSTKEYTSLSSLKRKVTDERIWLEAEFKKDNSFWVWWALSHSNQIILVSANSDDKLNADEYNLFIFMLDRMEIYASEFGE